MRKWIISIVVLLLLGSGFYYLYFVHLEKVSRSSYKAIPNTTAIVWEYESVEDHITDLYRHSYATVTDSATLTRHFASGYRLLKQLFANQTDLQHSFQHQQTFFCWKSVGYRENDFLFIVRQPKNLLDVINYTPLDQLINQLSKQNISTSSFKIGEQKGYRVKQKGASMIFLAYTGNLLLASSSKAYLKSSVKGVQSEESALFHKRFTDLQELQPDGDNMHIYINYQNFFNHSGLKEAGFPSLFKTSRLWSGAETLFKKPGVLFSGYTTFNDSIAPVWEWLRQQKPQKTKMFKVLPQTLSSLYWMGFSDYQRFFEHSKSSHPSSSYFESSFAPWIGNEVGMAHINTSEKLGRAAFLHLETPDSAQSAILQTSRIQKIDNYMPFTIYRYEKVDENSNFYPLKGLFNHRFEDISTPYFTFIDDYAVFSERKSVIEKVIEQYVTQSVVKRDLNYLALQNNISSTANLLYYVRTPYARPLLQPLLAPKDSSIYHQDYKSLQNFQQLAFQFSSMDKYFYTNGCLLYNEEIRPPVQKTNDFQPIEIQLDTNLSIPPQVVLNHKTKGYEIIVQDCQNHLYLMNPQGEILWKREIGDSIRSPIYQIDMFGNGKLQYIFNTKEKIHVIDRLSRDVEDYPKDLGTKAASPLKALVYENSSKYRYFIACEDRNLYGYYPDGEGLPGWSPKKDVGTITQPLQYFYVDGLDYLLAVNQKGTFYGFNRTAEERIPTTELKTQFRNLFSLFSSEGSHTFISTDTTGQIYRVNTEGEVDTHRIDTFSSTHHFAYRDVTEDEGKEYVFLDQQKLQVFDTQYRLDYSYVFDHPITTAPVFVQLPDREYEQIGVVDQEAGKIYLFRPDGALAKGFPLEGDTRFGVKDIYQNGKPHLIVGHQDKVLLYPLADKE